MGFPTGLEVVQSLAKNFNFDDWKLQTSEDWNGPDGIYRRMQFNSNAVEIIFKECSNYCWFGLRESKPYKYYWEVIKRGRDRYNNNYRERESRIAWTATHKDFWDVEDLFNELWEKAKEWKADSAGKNRAWMAQMIEERPIKKQLLVERRE